MNEKKRIYLFPPIFLACYWEIEHNIGGAFAPCQDAYIKSYSNVNINELMAMSVVIDFIIITYVPH